MLFRYFSWFSKLDILILVIVMFIGLIHLPYPFSGDQALFTIGAEKMRHGGILYRDFWDLKQPGIYSFYFLAGSLFGFNEIGIHAFELIYMLAFSIVLIGTLKHFYRHSFLTSFVPLLTVGVYYSVSGGWHLTQVEALVGFPIFLCLWFSYRSCESQINRTLFLFLSGLMGGVVLLFKFVLAPILLGLWLVAFINILSQKPSSLKTIFASDLVKFSASIGLGILLPLLLTSVYFSHFNTFDLLYKTSFEYPPRIVTEIPDSVINKAISSTFSRLTDGLRWFIKSFAPLIALGLLGTYLLWSRSKVLLTINFLVWIGVGLAVIFLQRTSLWQYQYSLLFAPLGILAVKGLDVIWEYIRTEPLFPKWRRIMVAGFSLILLFSLTFITLARKSIALIRWIHKDTALGKEQQLQYQSKLNDNYRIASKEVAFLAEPQSLKGEIYVCGDPTFYFLSGRGQAIPINGWSLEYVLPEQWLQITDQLAKARPPYIFIATVYKDLIPTQSPEMTRLLQDHYHVLHKSNIGTWYLLAQP